MASLSRAYGARGVVIAVSTAAVVGVVHGTLAAVFDVFAMKLVVGILGSIAMIIAGTVSARQQVLSAVVVALTMATIFFVLRWSAWAIINDGSAGLQEFLTALPLGAPQLLLEWGITRYWMLEVFSMFVPALIGCIAGFERAEPDASSAQSSS